MLVFEKNSESFSSPKQTTCETQQNQNKTLQYICNPQKNVSKFEHIIFINEEKTQLLDYCGSAVAKNHSFMES